MPAFHITVDGNDIAQLISPRLMSLDLTDSRGIYANLRKGLETKRERSWSNTTLGDVLGDIALGNGLTATIASALDGLPILQLDQANESDTNLISRVGEEFDAVVTI